MLLPLLWLLLEPLLRLLLEPLLWLLLEPLLRLLLLEPLLLLLLLDSLLLRLLLLGALLLLLLGSLLLLCLGCGWRRRGWVAASRRCRRPGLGRGGLALRPCVRRRGRAGGPRRIGVTRAPASLPLSCRTRLRDPDDRRQRGGCGRAEPRR